MKIGLGGTVDEKQGNPSVAEETQPVTSEVQEDSGATQESQAVEIEETPTELKLVQDAVSAHDQELIADAVLREEAEVFVGKNIVTVSLFMTNGQKVDVKTDLKKEQIRKKMNAPKSQRFVELYQGEHGVHIQLDLVAIWTMDELKHSKIIPASAGAPLIK